MEKNIIMLRIKGFRRIKKKGFTYDFNLHEDDIVKKSHYQIVHIYRYEGDSNPDDEAVVYGITTKSGENGVFNWFCSKFS
jgi:hypothetical protein